MIRLITVCLLVAVAYSTPEVLAQSSQSKTANLKVSATVVANCIVTTTDVNFGNYDPVGTNATAPLDADGSVTLACTRGTLARVRMNYGSNASGNIRRMANGPAFLNYEIYINPQRSTPWNSNYTFTGGAAPSSAPRTMPVYGRVIQGQDVPAGAFTDTVLVIVTF
jgi:spore coat protein U-like protein